MTTYRTVADRRAGDPAPLSFGDICSATFLYDVRAGSVTASLAPVDRSGSDPSVPDLFACTGTSPTGLALAEGDPVRRAVVLTDDCSLDTALGRRDPQQAPRGTIAFAPLVDVVTREQRNLYRHKHNFGVLALPHDELVAVDRFVDLGSAFSVSAASVADALGLATPGSAAPGGEGHAVANGPPEARAESAAPPPSGAADTWPAGDPSRFVEMALTDDAADDLAIRWTAHTNRRGPLVVRRNVGKLGKLLTDAGADEETTERVQETFLKAAERAWQFEGVLAGAVDQGPSADPRAQVEAILGALRALHAEFAAAVTSLEAVAEER